MLINKTKLSYVDIIHTNGGGLGCQLVQMSIGTVDYFPNGGSTQAGKNQ